MIQRFLDQLPGPSDDGTDVVFAYLRAVSVRDDGDTLVLTIDVQEQRWEVECAGVQADRAGPALRLAVNDGALEFSSAAIHTDHPLLWPWNRHHLQVFFSSTPAHPNDVIVELLSVHERVVADNFPFLRFLNASSVPALSRLLVSGSGCLATAPAPLAHAYSGVLAGAGCRPFISDLIGGAASSGSQPEPCPYCLLTLGASSFVVAERFSAQVSELPGGA